MKKIIVIIIIYLIICFAVPILFTKRYSAQETTVKAELKIDNEDSNVFDYKQYSDIKLLHTSSRPNRRTKIR